MTSTQPHAADPLKHDLAGAELLPEPGASDGGLEPSGFSLEDAEALLRTLDPPADLPDPDLNENSLKVLSAAT